MELFIQFRPLILSRQVGGGGFFELNLQFSFFHKGHLIIYIQILLWSLAKSALYENISLGDCLN